MTQLKDVNTTDIRDAIRLGCQNMCKSLNADDGDIPYGSARVRPEAGLGGSSEAHSPGRHLNAVLNAEDAAGIELDEDCIDKQANAAFFSYSRAALPLTALATGSTARAPRSSCKTTTCVRGSTPSTR